MPRKKRLTRGGTHVRPGLTCLKSSWPAPFHSLPPARSPAGPLAPPFSPPNCTVRGVYHCRGRRAGRVGGDCRGQRRLLGPAPSIGFLCCCFPGRRSPVFALPHLPPRARHQAAPARPSSVPLWDVHFPQHPSGRGRAARRARLARAAFAPAGVTRKKKKNAENYSCIAAVPYPLVHSLKAHSIGVISPRHPRQTLPGRHESDWMGCQVRGRGREEWERGRT